MHVALVDDLEYSKGSVQGALRSSMQNRSMASEMVRERSDLRPDSEVQPRGVIWKLLIRRNFSEV